MNYEFVEGRKGSQLIYFETYLFRREKQYINGDVTYSCRTSNCKVRGNLRNNSNFLLTSDRQHSHLNDIATVEVMKRKKDAIDSAMSRPTTSMKRLYTEAFASEAGDIDALVPAFKSMKSSMYRKRSERLPKQPLSRTDIEIQDEWRKTRSDLDFLQIDDGEEDRILAFFTIPGLRILASSNMYLMDGTFHVAARFFYQLYIIYASAFDTLVPICYALLPDKSEITYKRLFRLLQMKARQFEEE